MAIQGDSLRLEQQLRLQQRLNPQSVALGRVLEMSEPEFEDEVRRELDDNPALEASESREENHDDDEGFDGALSKCNAPTTATTTIRPST